VSHTPVPHSIKKRYINATTGDHRLTQRSIRLCIPKHYYQEPVISQLVSHYRLTVNITAALLEGKDLTRRERKRPFLMGTCICGRNWK
jgi:hypothetical protein